MIEVFNMELKENHTGFHWSTDNGEIGEQGKTSMTWSATKTKFTSTFDNEETTTFDYQLIQDTLYLGEIVYIKQTPKQEK